MYAAVIYLLKGKRHFKKDYYIRRDGRFNEVKKWINQSNQWPVLVLKHNQNLILMDHIWQCTVHQQSVSELGGRKSTVIISLNINQVTLITCGWTKSFLIFTWSSEDLDVNMSNFGEILKEINSFGLFQKRLVVALCIPSIFLAFDVIGQVFVGMSFPHNCNTDWIMERGPNLTEERQKNLTIPVKEDGGFESCLMFTPVDWDLEMIEKYGINTTTECVNGTDFEASGGASSIVTEVKRP